MSQASVLGIGGVPHELGDPRPVGLGADARDLNAAAARCIRPSTGKRGRPRGVQSSTVKQAAAASTSPWAARHSRQVVRVLLRAGAGSRPRSLRTLARRPRATCCPRLPRAPRLRVSPHSRFSGAIRTMSRRIGVHAPWAARSATAAAVVCPRDQLSMPAEEGIGRDQGVCRSRRTRRPRRVALAARRRRWASVTRSRPGPRCSRRTRCSSWRESMTSRGCWLIQPATATTRNCNTWGKSDRRGEPSRGSRRSRTSRPGERPA